MIQSKKATFLKEEDLPVISEAVLSKLQSLKGEFNVLAYYFNAVKNLLQIPDAYEALKELLFDRLLIIKSSHPAFKEVWNIYAQTLKAHMASKKET